MKNIVKKILLLLLTLFGNLVVANAKETTIRTCKYELNNLGSVNTAYVEIKFKKNCSDCSVHAYIDLDKSYYFDEGKSLDFSTISGMKKLQFKENNKYNNEEKNNCPEALFLGIRDGHWVTVNIGTKNEMQQIYDNNRATGGYDYHYRDRYIISESGILTDADIVSIDNRLLNRKEDINKKYQEYEAKECPPYTGNFSDGDYLKKWQKNLEIKGKTQKEITNLLEECKTLKNNLKTLITSAEDELKDVKKKGYDVDRDAAKNLQSSIATIKNINSSIDNSSNGSNYGKDKYGCEVVPDEVRKWIKIILNFVKYIALILVVVLGTLDFIKAAGSGEADSMKKAGQSFLKRVIAVIILFLLPMIVELILNLINLYGSTGDCFGVLE